MADCGPTEGATVLSPADFQQLYDRLRNEIRWGPLDRRGALNNISRAAARWSFLCAIAPMRLPIGTGSPVNPIAVF